MEIKDIKDTDYPAIVNFCNNFNLVLIKIDANLDIVDVNQVAMGIFDLTYSYIVGKSIDDVFNAVGIDKPIQNRVDHDNLELKKSSVIVHNNSKIDINWSYSRILLEEQKSCKGFLILGKTYNPLELSDRFSHLRMMDKLMHNVPANVFSKALDGTHLFVNQPLAECAGLKISDMVGRKDYALPWAQYADKLQEADNEAISTKQTIVVEEKAILANGSKCVFISTKSPLYDRNNNIVGTFGMAVNIKTVRKNDLFEQLPQEQILYDKNNPIALSSREIECINWMVKGKSAEEIGKILNLSRRTIETHIDNIKSKTKCYKQFQLGYIIGKYTSTIV